MPRQLKVPRCFNCGVNTGKAARKNSIFCSDWCGCANAEDNAMDYVWCPRCREWHYRDGDRLSGCSFQGEED